MSAGGWVRCMALLPLFAIGGVSAADRGAVI